MKAPVTIRARTRPTAAAGTVLTPVASAAAGTAAADAPIPAMSGVPVPPARPPARPATRSEDTYAVGYGKPPRGRPFAPGQSGNPKGRPRGAKNDHTLINEALNEVVTVRENGRELKIPKREVGARRFANLVAEGNFKALTLWLRLFGVGSVPTPQPEPGGLAAATDDAAFDSADVIAELMAMARRAVASDVGDKR